MSFSLLGTASNKGGGRGLLLKHSEEIQPIQKRRGRWSVPVAVQDNIKKELDALWIDSKVRGAGTTKSGGIKIDCIYPPRKLCYLCKGGRMQFPAIAHFFMPQSANVISYSNAK